MTKLTPELQDAFVKMRKLGISIKRCCEALGLEEKTYYLWMKLGKRDQDRPESKYLQFRQAINRSQAEALAELMTSLDNAGKHGSVNALIIRGQHQFPEEFPRDTPKDINLSLKPTVQQINDFYLLKEKEKNKLIEGKKTEGEKG